jgi:hypothetical protein
MSSVRSALAVVGALAVPLAAVAAAVGFSSVRFTGCGSNPRSGNAYAGGFYLASPSACVPLLVRVGTRSRTVRFGIGQTCS